jgi:hypothetical protein
VKCYFNKVGFVNNEDEPQFEMIVNSLQDTVVLKPKTLEKIAKKCFKFEGEYTCEKAFKVDSINNSLTGILLQFYFRSTSASCKSLTFLTKYLKQVDMMKV